MEKLILMGVLMVLWILLMINRSLFSELLAEGDLDQLLKMTGNQSRSRFLERRIKNALSIVLLVLVSIYSEWHLFYILIWVVVAIWIYKMPYLRLKRDFNLRVKQLKYEFPIWLRQLQILLQNNTVVVSLEKSHEFAPQLIQNHLYEFTNKLKRDPQNLETYMSFLEDYQCVEVERAMKLLYRYNSVGKEDSMKQLNRMVASTSKWLREQRLDKQTNQAFMKQWWGIMPLFGVTIVFIAMMMQTFSHLLEGR